jgi:tryptophan-rich hypothetical protein
MGDVMSVNAPHEPSKLPGSHWTAVDPEERRKHWEVVRYAEEEDEVTLRAVIDGETVTIPWRDLRDREVWKPGWA